MASHRLMSSLALAVAVLCVVAVSGEESYPTTKYYFTTGHHTSGPRYATPTRGPTTRYFTSGPSYPTSPPKRTVISRPAPPPPTSRPAPPPPISRPTPRYGASCGGPPTLDRPKTAGFMRGTPTVRAPSPAPPLKRANSFDFSDLHRRKHHSGVEYFEGVSRPYVQYDSVDPVTNQIFRVLGNKDMCYDLMWDENRRDPMISQRMNPTELWRGDLYSLMSNTLFVHSRCHYTVTMMCKLLTGDSNFIDKIAEIRTCSRGSQCGLNLADLNEPDMFYGFVMQLSDPGGPFGHIFIVTKYADFPPVVWQSNFYQMTLDDFMHERPRGRLDLEEYVRDIQRNVLDAPDVSTQRFFYEYYFGGETQTARKLGGVPSSLRSKFADGWQRLRDFQLHVYAFKAPKDVVEQNMNAHVGSLPVRANEVREENIFARRN